MGIIDPEGMTKGLKTKKRIKRASAAAFPKDLTDKRTSLKCVSGERTLEELIILKLQQKLARKGTHQTGLSPILFFCVQGLAIFLVKYPEPGEFQVVC